mmetsp:Transcript_4335/g.12583  ORF Transcript_4335/g.12583 Transcript_4335/m.12583 type:complete len:221 (-) Transcript_4335:906-1568(-)
MLGSFRYQMLGLILISPYMFGPLVYRFCSPSMIESALRRLLTILQIKRLIIIIHSNERSLTMGGPSSILIMGGPSSRELAQATLEQHRRLRPDGRIARRRKRGGSRWPVIRGGGRRAPRARLDLRQAGRVRPREGRPRGQGERRLADAQVLRVLVPALLHLPRLEGHRLRARARGREQGVLHDLGCGEELWQHARQRVRRGRPREVLEGATLVEELVVPR